MRIALALLAAWAPGAAAAALDGRRQAVAWGCALAILAQLVLVALLAAVVLADGPREVVAGDWPAGVGIRLRADALGVTFALVSVAVVLAATVATISARTQTRAFPSLVALLSTGLTGLFLTADVFSFYVFFELSMLAAYGLASTGDRPTQPGAGLILAVVNLLGSTLLLIGIAALYRVAGTLEFQSVADRLAQAEPASVALVAALFFVALAIKLGLFPFHFWVPSVYAAVTPPVAAILSGALANIAAYGLLRFGGALLPGQLELGATALSVLGGLSILYGAVQAIGRRDRAEVLAYSAVAQAGYVVLAVGLGGAAGFAAATIFALANGLTKALLFLGLRAGGALMAAAFAIGAMSVAGVPPTAGFVGKLAIVRAALDEAGAATVALLVVGSALSFLYMFQAYQYDVWRGEAEERRAPAAHVAAVCLLLAAVVGLGLWPEPLLAAGEEAAAAIGRDRP